MSYTLRLNPFEVREVLQEVLRRKCDKKMCLNPFEVREVLQAVYYWYWSTQ